MSAQHAIRIRDGSVAKASFCYLGTDYPLWETNENGARVCTVHKVHTWRLVMRFLPEDVPVGAPSNRMEEYYQIKTADYPEERIARHFAAEGMSDTLKFFGYEPVFGDFLP